MDKRQLIVGKLSMRLIEGVKMIGLHYKVTNILSGRDECLEYAFKIKADFVTGGK